MTTETTTTTTGATGEEKINQLRELFADAPEVGKKALENVLGQLTSQASQKRPPPVQSAGRVGSRLGKVSELTIIANGARESCAASRLMESSALCSPRDLRFAGVATLDDRQDAQRTRTGRTRS